ncbi:MAG: germination protein Ger(x)C family [Pelosinus sp.]|nr:germination protein Ger(x)C family [Pelosinus sp.]
MRKGFFLSLIFLILFTSGCWDRKEIDELAIVGATGFDKVTVNGRHMYRAISYVYKPAEMGGGAEGGNGKTLAPFWVVSELGETLSDAEKNISARSSRFVFLAHSDMVIVGERLAREDGVDKVMDLLLRHKDLRMRNLLYIAEGETLRVFERGLPQFESTLSQELAGISEKSLPIVSKTYVPDVKEFVYSLLATGRDPVAGKLEVFPTPEELSSPVGNEEPQSFVRPTGAAVFRESKLAGWLTDTETRGFLYVINKAQVGIIPLKLPNSPQENFSFQMTKAKTKIIPSVKNDNISITLEVKAEGNVGTMEDSVSLAKPEDIKKLEALVAAEIKQLIKNTVDKTQNMEADVFGFGEAVHRKYPKVWKNIEEEWRNIYSDLQVEVKVETKIRGTGMISNPITVESR